MEDQTGGAGLCKAPFAKQATQENREKAITVARRINKAAAELLTE